LYRLAAEQGYAPAQDNLGWMYQKGRGVPQDYKEAVKWYRLAAEQGYAYGQNNLGVMYEQGRGVSQDNKEAVRLYRLAADQGYALAQSTLGVMYRDGLGVPQDYKEAVRLYRLAVEQGNADGQTQLGWMYETGRGVSQDNREAVRLYRLAAEQGNAFAEDKLAELGIPIDNRKNSKVITSKSDPSSEALDALRTKAEREERKRKELEQQLAALKEQQSEPKTVVKTEPKPSFPDQPIDVQFTSVPKRQDDIAVIIGNANYEKQGKDIPNVNPAYADAEGIKRYFMQAKGVREGNIIYLKDATGSQLLTVFGNQNTHKGQLYNWVKPTVSNVYIYYAGHGVPGGDKGNAYLVPTDANAQSIGLSGYPLETLYSNLGKLPAKSVTVILEACFSGASQAGNLFSKSSPIVIRATKTMIPENVKVISAGAVDQMASWEQDNSHGLFTKYFLKAMSGEGDKNNDGEVSDTELKNYLDETMTYYARRYYGRDQTVQIMQGN
jgi:hypothetical protein